ncbi:MAG: hypothetical protein Q9169_000421 [Polycauliona sp. 2 TL-2023]
MFPFNRSLHLLCVVQLLFHFTASQLLGSITRSNDRYVLDISISNPTNHTISILSWNNIFDYAVFLPVSLDIRDDQGQPLRMATMYAMRAGMNDADFRRLAPKAVASRAVDLRSLLLVVPEGRSGNISLALPDSFKGVSHNGEWTVSPAAAANVAADPAKLGDFSAAGLHDISLTSKRMALELDFPLFDNDGMVDSNARAPVGPIQIGESCRDSNGTNMTDFLFDTANYAKAISLAAKDRSSAIFANYFASPARKTVATVASLVQELINGQGPQFDMYCTDPYRVCERYPNILGYTSTPSHLGTAAMVLCPVARKLPRPHQPCSSNAGRQIGASTAHVVLHLMLTINSIFKHPITGSVYGSGSCQLLKNAGPSATAKNPDSYAQLAIAQWRYGLGGPPYNGKPCPPTLGIVPSIQ